MKGFLKIFLASFLALLVFSLVMFLLGVGIFKAATSDEKPEVKAKSVLVIDISKPLMEQKVESGFNIPEGNTPEILGLHDVVDAIKTAETDSAVKGILLMGASNPNGFATSEELRQALQHFKVSKKFLVAYGNYYTQRGYELANVADKIFLNPAGMLDWQGYGYQLAFFKDALDKLEVKPEVFYAGKFKSATEPFRLNKMSDANRLQVKAFIEELYQHFLLNTASARQVDTARLRQLATQLSMKTTSDALNEKLVDKSFYDDEMREFVGSKVGEKEIDKINFVTIGEYIKADRGKKQESENQVAIIYAQGDIVDGKGGDDQIGGERFRQLLRKARLDKKIKAVVFRVNSPGGSSLASEIIHRELVLLKKEKPVVVSMGDYAASGGYYISCAADSIFAMDKTLTGSIGVFSLMFDASKLMGHKLGITFDEVTTSPSATLGSPFRPMTDPERAYMQSSVDSVYMQFKSRVAAGRKLTHEFVDSIAQGRIWSGTAALKIGLVDRIGGMNEAIACAARMAKLKDYELRQWPVVRSFWDKLFGEKDNKEMQVAVNMKQQMGEEFYVAWQQFRQLKSWVGQPQMRLPFFIMPGN